MPGRCLAWPAALPPPRTHDAAWRVSKSRPMSPLRCHVEMSPGDPHAPALQLRRHGDNSPRDRTRQLAAKHSPAQQHDLTALLEHMLLRRPSTRSKLHRGRAHPLPVCQTLARSGEPGTPVAQLRRADWAAATLFWSALPVLNNLHAKHDPCPSRQTICPAATPALGRQSLRKACLSLGRRLWQQPSAQHCHCHSVKPKVIQQHLPPQEGPLLRHHPPAAPSPPRLSPVPPCLATVQSSATETGRLVHIAMGQDEDSAPPDKRGRPQPPLAF
mmetsp:Transcript_1181/g.3284  ORF Transcript_1181/g.3284 Transcript_1181/m.3284 type:complete len:272 (+) Transcript_1181:1414-2229(+)